ncbi:hypothetical protein ACH5RR_012780 [Cinchona calisaya]|uniref:Uncharacterized protein n=1 Tax=Cinchona calisaya TaxID=153742 RepID=A0ABD3AA70_9GENT
MQTCIRSAADFVDSLVQVGNLSISVSNALISELDDKAQSPKTFTTDVAQVIEGKALPRKHIEIPKLTGIECASGAAKKVLVLTLSPNQSGLGIETPNPTGITS